MGKLGEKQAQHSKNVWKEVVLKYSYTNYNSEL